MTRVLLVTPSFDSNSFGRTYVLWRLSRLCGFETKIIAGQGGSLWAPLRDDDIGADCIGVGSGPLDSAQVNELVEWADLVIAVKPVPASFGFVERVARKKRTPMIVDIDDPDLPPVHILRLVARQVIKPTKYLGDSLVRLRIGRYPRFVSNPILLTWHGGHLIPHVRPGKTEASEHKSFSPSVGFVGTNHPHKGLGEIRRAVAAVQEYGVTLTVTDGPPQDARPWENWVGRTTLEAGRRLVEQCDIVLLPSHRDPWSEGQLPAKLIDAMIAGRAIAVADVGPLAWALGDAGRVVEPGDVTALTEVLREYLDPNVRADVGARARARALEMFSEEAMAQGFRDICIATVEGR